MERLKRPKSNLFIWDSNSQFKDNKYDVMYWNNYEFSESDKVFSIPQLVEEDAEYLKSKYLSLIYNFGESKVNGKRIIDYLLIRQNFSYWWMTLFAEKCNFIKSPQIDNIIKVMALEMWLQEHDYQNIKFFSDNDDLANSVSQLANSLKIDFTWEKEQNKKQNKSLLKQVFHSLPNIIKSPIWLICYVFSSWSLKGEGVELWKNTTATTTFVSYLFNTPPEAIKEGRHESRYWTKLNNLLDDENHHSNWLHIYVKDNLLPSSKKARNLIRKFNSSKETHQVHITLASFISMPVIFLTLKDWYKVVKLNKLVHQKLQMTSDYLWPLFKKDCQDSMSGIPGISNLLNFNLFEKAMIELPNQKKGCYLQENMGWEFGFLSAWQEAGHQDNLIGFPHASISYWDLRNFFDPRSYHRKTQGSLPMPNYVGVNGDVAKNMYLAGGYPQEKLIEVESLRYLYLFNFPAKKAKASKNSLKEKVVLVAGDYSKEKTYEQLALLSNTFDGFDVSTRFIFKSHPACPIRLEDFPNLSGELSIKPIEELLKISDAIYTSLITSAAIDGYCIGLPVITILNGVTLNMSPLRGVKSVYFVKNSSELFSAINSIESTSFDAKGNYFYLDPNLPRWQKWLNDDFDKNNK